MLRLRVITGVILLLVVGIAVLFLPYVSFQVFLALVVSIGAWEWSRFVGFATVSVRGAYISLILIGIFLLKDLTDSSLSTLLWISSTWWLLAFAFINQYPKYSQFWGSKIVLSISGFFVLIPSWLGINYLRGLENFSAYILFLFAMVAAADIGAYFSGKAFGRTKLAVRVSPNKTWEGVLGGILACCLVASVVAFLYTRNITHLGVSEWLKVLFSAALLSLISVVGDLLESMVKRYRDLKDSGNLLPGHGGVLDRIDGITAAAPVYALLLLSDTLGSFV